jgi:hypothetical protein
MAITPEWEAAIRTWVKEPDTYRIDALEVARTLLQEVDQLREKLKHSEKRRARLVFNLTQVLAEDALSEKYVLGLTPDRNFGRKK